jgi:hypothetical protein
MDVQYPLFFLSQIVRDNAPEQIDIYDAVREAEAEHARAEEKLPGDGALFPLRITAAASDGALFGIAV